MTDKTALQQTCSQANGSLLTAIAGTNDSSVFYQRCCSCGRLLAGPTDQVWSDFSPAASVCDVSPTCLPVPDLTQPPIASSALSLGASNYWSLPALSQSYGKVAACASTACAVGCSALLAIVTAALLAGLSWPCCCWQIGLLSSWEKFPENTVRQAV